MIEEDWRKNQNAKYHQTEDESFTLISSSNILQAEFKESWNLEPVIWEHRRLYFWLEEQERRILKHRKSSENPFYSFLSLKPQFLGNFKAVVVTTVTVWAENA